MKKLFVSAIAMFAVALGFTACSSDEEIAQTPAKQVTVYASTEEPGQRTALGTQGTDGKYPVLWSEGDQIMIGSKVFTLVGEGGSSTGEFTGTTPATAGTYDAYYPSTYNESGWPREQTYEKEGKIPQGVPMKATGITVDGSGNISPISFKNLGGILRLNLTGTAEVTSITISATGLNAITLNCGEGVQLDEDNATPFHIAVQVQGTGTAYSGLKIVIYRKEDGYVCIKKAKTDITVQKSMITDINLDLTASNFIEPTNGHDYVELAGIKWATENVGAVDNITPKATDATYGYYYSQSDAITAAESWGGAWTLPTGTQWQKLLDECNWEWKDSYSYGGKTMNGYKVSDKNDDTKFIFLPATGIYEGEVCDQGSWGSYWSADNGRYLYFGKNARNMNSMTGNEPITVRPVSR